jgi:hypothetical protein
MLNFKYIPFKNARSSPKSDSAGIKNQNLPLLVSRKGEESYCIEMWDGPYTS